MVLRPLFETLPSFGNGFVGVRDHLLKRKGFFHTKSVIDDSNNKALREIAKKFEKIPTFRHFDVGGYLD